MARLKLPDMLHWVQVGLITKEQFCSFTFVTHQPFQTYES